jgi:hypothetical protein
MARRTYFAFHYQKDIWRASQVKNSWLTHADREASGFFNASLEESAKTTDEDKIKRMIDDALVGTTCTTVLIGEKTAERRYVKYEIRRTVETGRALLGIRIHKLKDQSGASGIWGPNPFAGWTWTDSNGAKRNLDASVAVYDWVDDDGYSRLGGWIEKAITATPW